MFLELCVASLNLAVQAAPGAILIDRNRADRKPAIAPPSEEPPAKPTARVTQAGSQVPIKGIRFVGAKAPATVAAAAARFLGRPASQQTLAELAAALSAAYGDSPVALYTIAVPDQDFEGGIVTISLTEGSIADIRLAGAPGRHALLRRQLARLLREKPLSRATFERQLTLARSIPGLEITPDFQDPDGSGALTLTVKPKQLRTKFTAGFSNRGVDSLGSGQFDLKGEVYGLARSGDVLSVSASSASNLKSYRYASASYAVPVTASGLTASASLAHLETRPRRFPVTGRANQAALSLSYPVVRSFTRSVDLSLGVDALDSDNAAFGSLIASERTRAARASVSVSDARPKRSVSLSSTLSKGVNAFGARTVLAESEPGFFKASASAEIAQSIGDRIVARVSASGQYSRDRLPAAERFAIGGEAIGRAFDTALLTGDRGGGGLAELAFRPLKGKMFQTSEVYGFVDGGRVTVLERAGSPTRSFTLASLGAGMRARFRDKAELGVEAARAIDDPYEGYGENWRVSVSYRLTL